MILSFPDVHVIRVLQELVASSPSPLLLHSSLNSRALNTASASGGCRHTARSGVATHLHHLPSEWRVASVQPRVGAEEAPVFVGAFHLFLRPVLRLTGTILVRARVGFLALSNVLESCSDVLHALFGQVAVVQPRHPSGLNLAKLIKSLLIVFLPIEAGEGWLGSSAE